MATRTKYTIHTVGAYQIVNTLANATYGIAAGSSYMPCISSIDTATEVADTTEPVIVIDGPITNNIACWVTNQSYFTQFIALHLSEYSNTFKQILTPAAFNSSGVYCTAGMSGNHLSPQQSWGLIQGISLRDRAFRTYGMEIYALADYTDAKEGDQVKLAYSSTETTLISSGGSLLFSIPRITLPGQNKHIVIPLIRADAQGWYCLADYIAFDITPGGVMQSVNYEREGTRNTAPIDENGEVSTVSTPEFFFGNITTYQPGGTTTGGNDAGENSDNSSNINTTGSRNAYQRDNSILADLGSNTGNKGGDGTYETGGKSTRADDTAGKTYIYTTDDDGNETKSLGEITGIDGLHSNDHGGLYIYKMNADTCGKLLSKLWDENVFTAISKWTAGGAASAILRLYQAPFEADSTGGKNIFLGGYDTEIFAPVAKQYKLNTLVAEFDWREFFGSFMDYDAQYTIWLPFVGFRDLDPSDYVGAHVKIYRSLDFLNGTIVYNIQTNTTGTKADSYERTAETITDTFTGSMASDIPFSSATMTNAISGAVGILSQTFSGITGAVSGNVGTALAGLVGAGVGIGTKAMQIRHKDYSGHGGGGGNFGLMQSMHIYILAYRPVQSVAAHKSHYVGYTSRVYIDALARLGDDVFVKMDATYLGSAIPDDYKADIDALLKQGVYT